MKRIFLVVAVLGAVALLGFACGGDDDDDGGSTAGATTAVATDTGGGGGETTVDVEASNFKFTPADFTAAPGGTVTFNYTNDSGTPHTFSVYKDDAHTELVDKAGGSGVTTDSITVTFDEDHDYYFQCDIHPSQMKGEIAVG